MVRSHSWSLLLGDDDAIAADEHEEFVRSGRKFRNGLLRHTRDSEKECPTDLGSNRWNAGAKPYMCRFAQPCPLRPIWASLPADDSQVDSDCFDQTSSPLVCVAFLDDDEYHDSVGQALHTLTTHHGALIVHTKSIVVEDGDEYQSMIFAMVGLQQIDAGKHHDTLGSLSPGSPVAPFNRPGTRNQLCSRAVQRQVVWAAVHQCLREEDGSLPDIVDDIYMLQDVYLYDRLYAWLFAQRGYAALIGTLLKEEIDLIVHEFGEETATHFLFVTRYIKHLRWASLVSILCLCLSAFGWAGFTGDVERTELLKRTIMAIFLPTWAFHFLADWRSTASKAGFRWIGSLSSVQNSVKEIAMMRAAETRNARRARYVRVLVFSVPLMISQLLIVFSVTVTFVVFEVYIYDVIWELMSSTVQLSAFLLYNLAFGIAFILILALFHPISKAVTRWERHPDKETADWHLTAKIYANWFLAVFLYFFVIAFCYIPFGDNIADGVADWSWGGTATQLPRRMHEKYSIRGALQAFKPDTRRIAMDVSLFFLLQDGARLMQMLIPVIRGAWSAKKEGGQRRRSLRSAMIFGTWCSICRRRKLQACESKSDFTNSDVYVLYCFLEKLQATPISHGRNRHVDQKAMLPLRESEKIVQFSMRWAPQARDVLDEDDKGIARSRLHAVDLKGFNGRGESQDEMPGDLLTIRFKNAPSLGNQQRIARARLSVTILGSDEGSDSSPSMDDSFGVGNTEGKDIVLTSLDPSSGTMSLGYISINYTVGVVHAPTHYEALERVPRALGRARMGFPRENMWNLPPPETVARENASQDLEEGRLPWLWWDAELLECYWADVFELYTVKESFETFELYAHLATQLSYVCLFGQAVSPIACLAWLFTTLETRQDQLRLLWLSRPPHPPESMRFKRTVTLGAWYTIIKFTCHLSVVVNLLLWGLTYRGLGDPAVWSTAERWRASFLFLLCQQACFFLGGLLHEQISQLDHDTAAAYLRRCCHLQEALAEKEEKRFPHPSRQDTALLARRRLTREGSIDLSGLT